MRAAQVTGYTQSRGKTESSLPMVWIYGGVPSANPHGLIDWCTIFMYRGLKIFDRACRYCWDPDLVHVKMEFRLGAASRKLSSDESLGEIVLCEQN
jgi:hypothetical protein